MSNSADWYTDNFAALKATRADWTLTTWADGFGNWHCKVSSPTGWGNAGPHDVNYHINAIRARARRAIRREIAQRQGAPVGTIRLEVEANEQDSFGVLRSITFRERTDNE